MNYTKSKKYDTKVFNEKIMGPNPIKLEDELLLQWAPEQLDYKHDVEYWSDIVGQCREAEIAEVYEMESNDEVWVDWIKQDNEYARGDRAAIEAGGGKCLNFI